MLAGIFVQERGTPWAHPSCPAPTRDRSKIRKSPHTSTVNKDQGGTPWAHRSCPPSGSYVAATRARAGARSRPAATWPAWPESTVPCLRRPPPPPRHPRPPPCCPRTPAPTSRLHTAPVTSHKATSHKLQSMLRPAPLGPLLPSASSQRPPPNPTIVVPTNPQSAHITPPW